jgi:uncharacterized membrane protein YqjE
MESSGDNPPGNGFDPEPHPAREMSLHLLRMLETRMDAAGIALQAETQLIMMKLQLKLLAAAAIFIAIWGGIVLLAIALPPDLRVPVLSAVVVGFVIAGVACFMIARRKASTREVGSLAWFLDSLRLDLEVLSRTLSRSQAQPQPQEPQPEPEPEPEPERSRSSDIAA